MPIIRDFKENFLERLDNLNSAQKTDFERISELLKSTPAGARFIGNQALLAQSTIRPADIIQDPISGLTDIGARAVGTAAQITAILGQVRVNGTGTHFLIDETGLNTYLGTSVAAAEAKYAGTITVKRTRKMKGTSGLDYDRGFGGAGKSDFINTYGYLTDENEIESILAEDLDLVPFNIKVLKAPNDNVTPFNLISFRSFITNISDSFNGSWNSSTFVGRGEPFYVYTGHTRRINFALRVAAFSQPEVAPLHDKVNALVSTTAPEYSDAGYMKGVIVKLTLGNYVKNLIGHIDSVGVSITTDYPWETEDRTLIVPTIMDLNISFVATPGQAPQAAINGITSTFINQK
jgi:hypothetical protein